MASAELDAMRTRLFKDIDRVVDALNDLSGADARWQPVESGTSVLVLARHVVGSAENMVVRLAGGTYVRDRDAEFLTPGEPGEMRARADAAKGRISAAFDALDPSTLGNDREAPPSHSAPNQRVVPAVWTASTGPRNARELLLQQISHTAEHAGHAELTRDLAKARAVTK